MFVDYLGEGKQILEWKELLVQQMTTVKKMKETDLLLTTSQYQGI